MRNSSSNPENQKLKIGMTISAITLTPSTVGRPSADLSADEQPINARFMLRLHSEIQSADRIFVFLSADKHHFVGRLERLH